MSSPLSFFRQNPYNSETREHLWSSVIVDCHDSFCGCTSPISHWLSIIFPEGHKDRYLTVNEIIHRELHNQQCLFGGEEDKNGGEAAADNGTDQKENIKEEEDLFTEENIEDLLHAAENAERR